MVLPLIPLAIGAGTFFAGSFFGSQVDDAIEGASVVNPKSFPEGFNEGGEVFTFSNIIKLGLLAGALWVGTKAIKQL